MSLLRPTRAVQADFIAGHCRSAAQPSANGPHMGDSDGVTCTMGAQGHKTGQHCPGGQRTGRPSVSCGFWWCAGKYASISGPSPPYVHDLLPFRHMAGHVIKPCQLRVIMLHGPAAVHTRLVRRVCAEPIHRADPNGVAVMLQAAAAGGGMMGTTIIGTYGYMAPEQFRGAAQPASDLYALGGTLLFLLSGTAADPKI